MYIIEPQKKTTVSYQVDLCVVGGSATGVFAAVRAARLGLKVLILEKQNCFGGVATNGLVNVWHSYLDTERKKQIIAGLSEEITDRLEPFNAGHVDKAGSHCFNPHELKTELDRLVLESGVTYLFHTYYVGLITEDNKITAILIQNKDGRSAVKADFFIDATGDGDLARDLGMESYVHDNIQPPSACFLLQGDTEDVDVQGLIAKYGEEFGLSPDWGWSCVVPRCREVSMRAETHVFGLRCDRAAELSQAEVEGRRKIRAVVELLNQYGKPGAVYNNLCSCSHLGIRETVHYKTRYQAKELDLLLGKKYEDVILNGTYGVDIHHAKHGITFRHFDGSYSIEMEDGSHSEGNWRKEQGISADVPIPTYYQLPFRCIVPEKWQNLIAAGRM
ncbi:MAG: FAD-dependent oxidoreductase, partial [Eubacteriales bacterium]